MTYATLLVHLHPGQESRALLDLAVELATRFDAQVIGVAACQPLIVVSGDGTVCGDVFADDVRQMQADLDRAEEAFRTAFAAIPARIGWRSAVTVATLADYLSAEARCADLIVTGSVSPETFNLARNADLGALALQAGRPILVAPETPGPMRYRRAVVAWKDTREARRAACDALPMLGQMAVVEVVEVAAKDQLDDAARRTGDVVDWLGRHGVSATGRVEAANGGDAERLLAIVDGSDVDLVVAGAYGHSRLREWVTGGVTRDLLLRCDRCVLTSH